MISSLRPVAPSPSMNENQIRARFARMAFVTAAAIYFLIMVGGVVRASGSGMGCPDWPTCFGRWIPPTEETQLPANYHEIYAQRGYADTSFNVVKTWTEYVNRLIGVTIGGLILLTLWRSMPFRKIDPPVVGLATAVFLLVGFQGWLGSAVVASNLKPMMITAHMVTAFVLVSLLIYTLARAQAPWLRKLGSGTVPARVRTVLWVAAGLTLLQIAMGTQIREAVDVIAVQVGQAERDSWRENFPIIFYIHRSFSSVLLFTNLWLAWTLYRNLAQRHPLRRLGVALAGLVSCAILSGVTLDRLGFPAVVQPLHLLLANLIFGTQFFLAIALRYAASAETKVEPDIDHGVSLSRS